MMSGILFFGHRFHFNIWKKKSHTDANLHIRRRRQAAIPVATCLAATSNEPYIKKNSSYGLRREQYLVRRQP